MTVRPTTALALTLLTLAGPSVARAQKLDKDDKKWLDTARPLMTPDEEKTYKGQKDKSERQEFQKIFWARRDPNLETPENEFQADYMKAFAEVEQYKVPGKLGAETDCGRIFLLLGKPDEVKKEQVGANPAARSPETWTYRDRPGQTFTGGKAEISVDETCALPAGAKLKEQLDRLAEAKVAQPNIGYKVENGHIVKLADQLPKPSLAQALLKTPRQDFPIAAQAAYLKVMDGGTALAGLVRGDASGLAVEDAGGKKTLKVVIAANLIGADGKVAAFAEEPTVAEVKDGHFVGSFRISAKAGKYTMRAGAIEEKSGKGSLAEMPIDVPNLNTGEMSSATILVLDDVQDTETPDPRHPYAAFALAKARLIPRFGGIFGKAEAASFFYQVYDLKTDEAGKASAVASVSMMKEASRTVVAKAADQPIDTPVGGTVVGPVPLAKYEPGKYIVQLKVRDNLAKKDLTQEVPFEVKP